MRKILLIPTLFLVIFPLGAHALGISVVSVRASGESTTTLAAGETITFDLRLENESNAALAGLGVSAFGYDPDGNQIADNGLRFVSGLASDSIFNEVVFEGEPLGGLVPTLEGPAADPREEANGIQGSGEPSPGAPLPLFVQLLGSGRANLPGATGDGTLDRGVDGDLIRDGDVHIRVTFEAMAIAEPTPLTLTFGLGDPTLSGALPFYEAGAFDRTNTYFPFQNDVWNLEIQAIPEPTTGLLIGLGLAGLARTRRSLNQELTS